MICESVLTCPRLPKPTINSNQQLAAWICVGYMLRNLEKMDQLRNSKWAKLYWEVILQDKLSLFRKQECLDVLFLSKPVNSMHVCCMCGAHSALPRFAQSECAFHQTGWERKCALLVRVSLSVFPDSIVVVVVSSVIMWAYDVENFYSPTASKIFNIINPH